ncbi:alcohol dehydrogenase [Ramlibacter sp. AN1015]|uniref:alcohol dehydrogenase n=1 Tax=Ramlibacter sp. AN1015 TaxID=3133428 RepID=UPI0030C5BDFE
MRAAVITEPKGPIQVVERDVPQPGAGQVLVKVQACGICHSDALTKEGLWPGLQYPRVPGHEIAGVIDALGPGVEGWQTGARVGVGWYGGHCGRCAACRSGDFVVCEQGQVPGISYDGGYAQYMVAPVDALARIPQDLSDVDAAPLLCAGITTFNALRNSGARAGDLVAIHGIGGLGHLGVQYAAKMGFRTVAIARGKDKEPLARQLGAHDYIDSTAGDPAEALKAMGGARVILATVTSGDAMSAVIPGLGRNGKLLIVGVAMEPVQVPTVAMIMNRASIQGWPSGTAQDSTETLAFSAMAQVRPMIEEYPLERAAEAYERMMSGGARFRVVLKMDGSPVGRR